MKTQNGVTANARGREVDEQSLVALLIAAEPAAAAGYGTKLRLDGYAVLTANSLEEGMEVAVTRRPDLIFVCLGSWAVPALVLLVLRSEPAIENVPVVLVSDMPRAELASEVGGLRSIEQVVMRGSVVHTVGDRASASAKPNGCGRPAWSRLVTPPR